MEENNSITEHEVSSTVPESITKKSTEDIDLKSQPKSGDNHYIFCMFNINYCCS